MQRAAEEVSKVSNAPERAQLENGASARRLKELVLDRDCVDSVRKALLIGLASFGEIERLEAEYQLLKVLGEYPDLMRPIHPTGDADTVSEFADALRMLES